MADKNGRLTEEDKKKVKKWLDEKGVQHACPTCNQNQWQFVDHLLTANIHVGSRLVIGGPTYPMVMLVCMNCAYVRQYMSIPMGVDLEVPSEEEGDG